MLIQKSDGGIQVTMMPPSGQHLIKSEKSLTFDPGKYLKDVITSPKANCFGPLTFSEVDFKLFDYALLDQNILVQFEEFEAQNVSGPKFQLHANHMQHIPSRDYLF